jgi:serine protease Do
VLQPIEPLNNATHIQQLKQWQHVDVAPVVWVLFSGKKHVAQVVYSSNKYDVSILKVPSFAGKPFRLSALAEHKRGLKVIACGYPGAASSLQTGSLSNPKDFSSLYQKMQPKPSITDYWEKRDFEYVRTDGTISKAFKEENGVAWLQHTAAVNPGNSGGPLLTQDGTVIGINTLTMKFDQGIFFSLTLPQLRDEIQKTAPGATWE